MSFISEHELKIKGASVSEGIAIGSAYFLNPIEEEIPDFAISLSEVDAEVSRYRNALFSSKEDLHRLRQQLRKEGSEEAISTIETHIEMLDDPIITTQMEGKIRQMLRNTESVFQSVINDYQDRFSERSDAFFRERLVDVQDVSKRILNHLRKKQNAQLLEVPSGAIVFSEGIAPSYIAATNAAHINAFVTNSGGGNSHAALIARSKRIPYVTSIEVSKLEKYQGHVIIVDGYEGIIIINPSQETIYYYQNKQKQLAFHYEQFLDEDHLKTETIDGYQTKLYINVGNLLDLEIFPYSHDGVGLFRTEYLFLQTEEFYPSEKYQYNAYLELINKEKGRPVVIRVFDLGGDKNPDLFHNQQREPNPILGNRGIRFLLRNRKLFKMQLRAIFKASIGANVHILLPLISDINELLQSKEIIEEVKRELRKDFSDVPDLPIGCMIEVPSAVLICDVLAKNCDFLSMGTNDLVQYTLGIDRANPAMSELYYPAHPSVLRMIKMISTVSKQQEVPLTICGEMASNKLFTPLLIGLGLKDFSVSPPSIPDIKGTIRAWTITEAHTLAEEALKLSDPKEISALLEKVRRN